MTETNAAAIGAKQAETPDARRRAMFWRVVDDYSLIGIFIVLFGVLSATVQYFFSWDNIVGLALSVSQIGMVACTMMFCLASRDFDLSVGSTVAFAGVCCAIVSNATGSVALGLAAGALIGFVNGVVIAKLNINALITTLATMEIVRGLAFITSQGQAVGVTSEAFFTLGSAELFGLPVPVWVTLACFVVFGILLNKTIYGRNTLAIGGNPDAARLAGVSVDRVRIAIFLIQGLVAALAGIILASRMTS